MKILLLYTARSGTNRICDYFLKQNSNYVYFNQPFTSYEEDGIVKCSYNDCIKYDNVIVKSEINSFIELNIKKEQIIKDFDKVVLISRKNKREQAISNIIASNNRNFLDKRLRKYYVEDIPNIKLNLVQKSIISDHKKLITFMDEHFRFFYYEDLYYGSFSQLFDYLNIKHIESDFESILNTKNKYNTGFAESKKNKTII